MIEKIFIKENVEYFLKCWLSLSLWAPDANYLFKLMQREKGKRKWRDIKGYERQYRASTDIEDILVYLTKEEIMDVARMEHERLSPDKVMSTDLK